MLHNDARLTDQPVYIYQRWVICLLSCIIHSTFLFCFFLCTIWLMCSMLLLMLTGNVLHACPIWLRKAVELLGHTLALLWFCQRQISLETVFSQMHMKIIAFYLTLYDLRNKVLNMKCRYSDWVPWFFRVIKIYANGYSLCLRSTPSKSLVIYSPSCHCKPTGLLWNIKFFQKIIVSAFCPYSGSQIVWLPTFFKIYIYIYIFMFHRSGKVNLFGTKRWWHNLYFRFTFNVTLLIYSDLKYYNFILCDILKNRNEFMQCDDQFFSVCQLSHTVHVWIFFHFFLS